MAKTGLELSLEKELGDVLAAPKADKKFSDAITNLCIRHLEDSIKKFRNEFLDKITSATNKEGKSVLLPDNCRYVKQTKSRVVFVIEQKPTVRTLFFDKSIGRSKSYRLSLPYMIFVPIFKFYQNKPYCIGLCAAYRNQPLGSLEDVLCYTNLPNISYSTVPELGKKEINSYQQLLVCQGDTVVVHGNEPCGMVSQVMEHFWQSEFSMDLISCYHAMADREPKLASLERWQKESRVDPTFVLKCEWMPAGRLDSLIDLAIKDEDDISTVSIESGRHANQIYEDVWSKLARGNLSFQGGVTSLFASQLDSILKKFAAELARGMTVINNDTMRRTVQIAIAKAFAEAVK